MLSVYGGPLVYMNNDTGELWAKLQVSLDCHNCSTKVSRIIDIPLRNNVFVGCKFCKNKSELIQIKFEIR